MSIKHIFCFTCACQTRETDQNCARCGDPVQRIEKCPRGAVFVCRIPACRRTYLSQRFIKLIFLHSETQTFRDLTAHIRHRHKANEAVAQGLQVEIPGTDGGTPVPAQPTSQAQAPQPNSQIHPGQRWKIMYKLWIHNYITRYQFYCIIYEYVLILRRHPSFKKSKMALKIYLISFLYIYSVVFSSTNFSSRWRK